MTGTAAPAQWTLLPGSLRAAFDVDSANGRRLRRTLRDWVVDVVLFLFAVATTLMLTAIALEEKLGTELTAVADMFLGLLACFALWLRRRWPVALAIVLTLVGCYSVTTAVVSAIAFFTVAVHRRFAVTAVVFAFGIGAGFVFPLVRPEWTEWSYWLEVVWGLLITAAVLAWGLFVRARRQLLLSLGDRAQRAETEQQLRVTQARQSERTRIAREMHDVLAHRISLLSLHAGALEVRPDAPAGEVARAAGVIRASAHQVLEDLREVIGVLREDPADEAPDRPLPGLADVPALVDECRQAGMRVRLDRRVDDVAMVPASVGRSAYRIVQEGLTNARKHASGSTVDVAVSGDAGAGLTVEVRNRWPVGASAEAPIPGAGLGIVGLAERVELAGGHLEHGRTDAGDFRLHAWLPWPT